MTVDISAGVSIVVEVNLYLSELCVIYEPQCG